MSVSLKAVLAANISDLLSCDYDRQIKSWRENVIPLLNNASKDGIDARWKKISEIGITILMGLYQKGVFVADLVEIAKLAPNSSEKNTFLNQIVEKVIEPNGHWAETLFVIDAFENDEERAQSLSQWIRLHACKQYNGGFNTQGFFWTLITHHISDPEIQRRLYRLLAESCIQTGNKKILEKMDETQQFLDFSRSFSEKLKEVIDEDAPFHLTPTKMPVDLLKLVATFDERMRPLNFPESWDEIEVELSISSSEDESMSGLSDQEE